MKALIVGGGIGGLATALALAQRGDAVTVIEAANKFEEIGAGIQLGPNAVKVLDALGLGQALREVASQPESIVIADALTGAPISQMLLGQAVQDKFGAPYLSLHRADLHRLLLNAAMQAGVTLQTACSLQKYEQSEHISSQLSTHFIENSDVLIGADGLWSTTRAQMLGDGLPRGTGHAAFRALIPAHLAPPQLRRPQVRVWWGRDVHVVCYPMRGGQLWNVVVLAQRPGKAAQGWSLAAAHEAVMRCFGASNAGQINQEPRQLASDLQAWLQACPAWQRWDLFDRPALSAAQMARGRVALLGDAAHPMLPYLAQGAAMALEDAAVLARCLHEPSSASAHSSDHVPQALARYAHLRATRNARVVRTARRNGQIFHLSGPLAWARNTVLAWQGTAPLKLDWLYGYAV